MNYIIKQGLIVISVFLIVLLYQNKDDKKYKKERTTFYDKYKFPILISSIIGLLLNIPVTCFQNTSITIIKPSCGSVNSELAKPFIHNNIKKPSFSFFGLGSKNQNKLLSDQQIFTDLPDF